MHVQVLRIQTSGLSNEQMQRYRFMLQLGVGEMAGLFSAVFTVEPGDVLEGVCFWESGGDIERFRHSELYARLQMCPVVEAVEDRETELKVRVLSA